MADSHPGRIKTHRDAPDMDKASACVRALPLTEPVRH